MQHLFTIPKVIFKLQKEFQKYDVHLKGIIAQKFKKNCLITVSEASQKKEIIIPASCLRMNIDGIEKYWNGSSCVNALGYGKSCTNSNECQHLTQNTTCPSSVPYKCQCSSTQYFNFINSKCEDLLSINEICTQIEACKAGFCFGKPLMCQCLPDEYFDFNTGQCVENLHPTSTTEDLISACLKISSATTIDGSGFEITTTP